MRAFSFARPPLPPWLPAWRGDAGVVGVLQVTGAWTVAMTWLRVRWIGGYELPL